jgi:hypothetical protein
MLAMYISVFENGLATCNTYPTFCQVLISVHSLVVHEPEVKIALSGLRSALHVRTASSQTSD